MSNNKTSVIVSLALGAALLAGAAYMYTNTRELISTAVKVPGTVVDFERRSSKGGSTDYPVIEYVTASGETHRFTTSGAGDFARGEAVEVLYYVGNPANARVNVFIELWLGSLALGALKIKGARLENQRGQARNILSNQIRQLSFMPLSHIC